MSSRQILAELSSDQNSSHVLFEIKFIRLISNTFFHTNYDSV